MVRKITPYRIKLSCRPLGQSQYPGPEEYAKKHKFKPTEVEWIRDSLIGLLYQPQISHNMYRGKKQTIANWIGIQSVIFDIVTPEPHEFEDLVVGLADHLECDICAYGQGRKARIVVPFNRLVDDLDERDVIKVYLMSKLGVDLIETFHFETVYPQDPLSNGGFCYTFHHGPMKIDEVLAYVPEPEKKIILPLSTEVETVQGEKLTFETLKPDTEFICPVCKDHKLPAPDGMNIVEAWQLDPGRSSYFCAWCQVLKNNLTGGIEVEPLIKKAAKAKP